MQKKAAKSAQSRQAGAPPALRPTESFQDLILALQQFWGEQGCVILQPYDMEVGAGTFHPATTLRALGPKPWNAAYVQPSRRPKDGRYGENPNRMQHYYQLQVIMKPSPADFQDLYLESLARIGIDPMVHDIRFVEDDWESPTLGAWGLGWEVWCDGMEVIAVHLLPAGRRLRLQSRLGRDHLRARTPRHVRAGRRPRVRPELQRPHAMRASSPTATCSCRPSRSTRATTSSSPTRTCCCTHFRDAEKECKALLAAGEPAADANDKRHKLALPAYDQCIKASHVFNLLDARGVISVTERQSYILRVRELAKACCGAWLRTEGGGA